MTLKQEYIQIRNSQKYEINWFYKYFKENGGKASASEVAMVLQQFGSVNEIISFLDKKFELNTLWDKDGQFIKVVE